MAVEKVERTRVLEVLVALPEIAEPERGRVIYVWLIGLSLLVTALFSAAEMSFIAANRVRLRHMAEGGNRTAVRYLEAFRQPRAAALHRHDGRDHRPHHRVRRGDLGAPPGGRRRGGRPGHRWPSPPSCSSSAR